MDAYRTRGDTELGYTGSTQTLGVKSLGSTASLAKNGRRVRSGLIFFCVLLLLVCIALAAYLIVTAVKQDGSSETDGEACKKMKTSQQNHCSSSSCLEVAGAIKQNLNESVDPCKDFFQYSCGTWIKDNPIPSSENRFSTFSQLLDKNNRKLLLLLLEDDDFPSGHAVKKTKDYFKSCMAEDQNDNTAVPELKRLITQYGSWPVGNTSWKESTWSLPEVLVAFQREFSSISPLFEPQIDTNPFKSSQHILKIMPPSLSLIREKYLNSENKTRSAYLKYMTKVGKLLGGGNDTKEQMAKVLELEGKIAKITPPRSELIKNFQRTMNITELQRRAPGFGSTWLEFINKLLKPFNVWVNASDSLIVPSPEYLRNLSHVVNETDRRTLSNYMMWTFVRSVVPYLSRDFRSALLEYQKEMEGKKAAETRWLSCLEDINSYSHGLTFALGYMWVSKVFDSDVIPLIQEMMTTIKTTFRDETSRYEWIDDQTRQKIIEKEKAMKNKIGFPKLCANETLLNEYYKDINISRSNYLLNALRVTKWRTRRSFSEFKNPVDKEQWYVGPQLVNAFYLPNRNEINILAGILQPPFFYGQKAPRAVNFGAIGMVLAHELSHGFDSTGQ
ncbi:endothelin-converting enzyme 1-like isoform X2 [Orbicella faveolata]|uniref:endothelin-converting enzyme 1-like isoform X2 n=1 Tax=Orbicella faveolata TaxID=48498 RepID=UPI0009E1DA66|nr:endothelin-converting enzyme 1-like isoform X2 [Orbicella faveolata]